MFYSQFDEDRRLVEIFDVKTPHLCVEVGANDGIRGSTTLFFEQQGWTCILVEPNPVLCAALRETRPDSVLFECGAGERDGRATLYIAEGADRADGVSSMIDPDAAQRHIAQFGFSARPVEVEVRTLDAILAESVDGLPVAFVSIDVEGFEKQVLRGFSLARWRPRIVLLEDNTPDGDLLVRAQMAASDYVPFDRTGVNDWYAHRDDPLTAGGDRAYFRRVRAVRRADLHALRKRRLGAYLRKSKLLWPIINLREWLRRRPNGPRQSD